MNGRVCLDRRGEEPENTVEVAVAGEGEARNRRGGFILVVRVERGYCAMM